MQPSEILKFTRPLWKHQADTLDWAAPKSNVALLHEMGVGKTTSAIAWARAKYNQKSKILSTLVISPVATLYNWLEEFERNAPVKVFEQCAIVYGSGEQRIKILADPTKNIFITNPEALDMEKVLHAIRNINPQIVILDESHRFKNHKSKRLKSLLYVSDLAPYRMILTGTPILNSYLDIWAQWRFLDSGETFGLNFFSFRERYFRDENIGWKGKPKYFPKYGPKPGIHKELSRLMDLKASRITKAECLSLPPLVRKIEYVALSKEQEKVYRQMETNLVAEVSSGVCVAQNALTRVLRMLQILTGYLAVEQDTATFSHRLKENPRLARLAELLEELVPNHKVIVWCTFQENYAAIEHICKDMEIPFATLTGQTKDRQEEIERFNNDPKCRVMISNPQAGGVGVNLTEASYSIYYSRSYSLGDRLQSEARNHRGGSEKHEKITLIDLVAKDTLDQDVLNALARKEDFSLNILDRLAKR